MGLSIIIPTHNRRKNLLKLVNSLSGITTIPDLEIIVVNDIVSDDLNEKLSPEIIYLINQKGGVAASRNRGAAVAKFPNLLFIDDDMLVTEAAVSRAYDFLLSNENAVLNVNWVYPAELIAACNRTKFGRFLINANQVSLQGWMDNKDWQEKTLLRVNSMASPFLAITKADFDKAGGYNELFPFSGFEDYDFSKRIVSNGIQVWLDTNYTIFHNEEENTVQENWLNRRERNSYTRGIGVSKLGITEMKIDYSGAKKTIFNLIYSTRGAYSGLLLLIPNTTAFDKIFTLFFRPLLGAYLMNGYKKGIKTK